MLTYPNLVLASQSPRRRELLTLLGHAFISDQADLDETLNPSLDLIPSIEDLASRKAKAVEHKHPESLIIAADTVVVLGQHILGKPQDKEDAIKMLSQLSGKTHHVITSVCLAYRNHQHCFTSVTDVTFYPLSPETIESYVETGSPMDKAGAYGIQDQGALLIEKIQGDYYTVMGLPIALLNRELDVFIQSL